MNKSAKKNYTDNIAKFNEWFQGQHSPDAIPNTRLRSLVDLHTGKHQTYSREVKVAADQQILHTLKRLKNIYKQAELEEDLEEDEEYNERIKRLNPWKFRAFDPGKRYAELLRYKLQKASADESAPNTAETPETPDTDGKEDGKLAANLIQASREIIKKFGPQVLTTLLGIGTGGAVGAITSDNTGQGMLAGGALGGLAGLGTYSGVSASQGYNPNPLAPQENTENNPWSGLNKSLSNLVG
jgi:hypothetical protein